MEDVERCGTIANNGNGTNHNFNRRFKSAEKKYKNKII
jgi:hypothetical protein